MPFIGNQPALSYTSFAKQDFSTSATTSYTLDNPVANANELALFINFVRQEPTTSYSASGTTLTLTSATSSSDDMYCVYLGKAVQTVNPPNASVGTSQLVDGAITSAKLASGTGGKILQVVQTVKTDTQTISTTSLTEISGLTAALTCSSTSNKVLITGQLSVGGTTGDAGYTLYAGATAIGVGDAASSRRRNTFGGGAFLGTGNEQWRVYTIPFCFLYSPSSTSEITYSIKKSDSVTTSSYINRSATDNDSADRIRAISTITVMEVAG